MERLNESYLLLHILRTWFNERGFNPLGCTILYMHLHFLSLPDNLMAPVIKTFSRTTQESVCLSGVMGPVSICDKTFFLRFREVLKFKLSHRFEIWQAHPQQCCRGACQIVERSNYSKYTYRNIETSRDLTIRRLIGYWNGTLVIRNAMYQQP